jgi:type III restriction enzyme
MSQPLNQVLDAAQQLYGPDFYKNKTPAFIYKNLKQTFVIRPYQQEAFGRFVFYRSEFSARPRGVPIQLLYHMATGSGKTLIMAGLIIYLYEHGYRNFLFFVNSTNIIDKTRDNFLNQTSSKYLFADALAIGDKQINIKEVENFQAANQGDINIVFSTIQGLHSRLNTPRENSLTCEDFEDKKIVLISDEAHHINADTKAVTELTEEEREERLTWENTVNRIFRANSENILLEFTATVDLGHPEIENKYHDKLLFDYSLRQFRKDGYSKEVKVLQADLAPLERALQAIILSQYRRKVFEKFKKRIKPVILFKSRTINESEEFYSQFIDGIRKLKPSDLKKITSLKTNEVIQRAFKYFETSGITPENLIVELKEDFSEGKCLSVNSKNESEEKQLAVNSLEDKKNEFRAVFAVDKLNEGWDVLNLFDIVRLYNTRDAKAGKPGRTTMSEAQLIGRGARYCPFQILPSQPVFSRKYDEDLENELRICEELYYHSAYNPRYIEELNTALEEIGIKPKTAREIPLTLKPTFKTSPFYKSSLLFLNEQQKYDRADIFSLPTGVIEHAHKVALRTGFTKTDTIFNGQKRDALEKKQKDYPLVDFGPCLIRQAINKLDFYQFANLKTYLPNLTSISEFMNSEAYFGRVKVEVSGLADQVEHLSLKDKLDATVQVLESIAQTIATDKIDYKGTKEFKPFMLKDKIVDKRINVSLDADSDQERGKAMSNAHETSIYLDLSQRDWYVFTENFGTSEEKCLVKFIDKAYDQLKKKYNQIFLVRNERHFKIYDFEDGRPVEPDFVLFLVKNNPKQSFHYQVFIEPKGGHLLLEEAWKEKFLARLKDEGRIEQLWQGKNYTVWGLPFYNEAQTKVPFEKAFQGLIDG